MSLSGFKNLKFNEAFIDVPDNGQALESVGNIRYNSASNQVQFYNGTTWESAASSSSDEVTEITMQDGSSKLNEFLNIQEYGTITVPTITKNGLTLDLTSCEVYLKIGNTNTAAIHKFTVPNTTGLPLSTGLNYIYIGLDGSMNPYYYATTDDILGSDYSKDKLIIASVYKNMTRTEGAELYLNQYQLFGGNSKGNMAQRRFQEEFKLSRSSGLILSSSSLNLQITAGVMYFCLNRFPFDSFDSSTDTFRRWWKDSSGNWQYDDRNTIEVTEYNDATGKATMSNNKYRVDYVYIDAEGSVNVIMGNQEYNTTNSAGDSIPRTDLPEWFTNNMNILIGRYIVIKDATATEATESVFNPSFNSYFTDFDELTINTINNTTGSTKIIEELNVIDSDPSTYSDYFFCQVVNEVDGGAIIGAYNTSGEGGNTEGIKTLRLNYGSAGNGQCIAYNLRCDNALYSKYIRIEGATSGTGEELLRYSDTSGNRKWMWNFNGDDYDLRLARYNSGTYQNDIIQLENANNNIKLTGRTFCTSGLDVKGLLSGNSWISMAAGVTDSTDNRIVIGNESTTSIIGAHNPTLSVWAPLNINRYTDTTGGHDVNISTASKTTRIYGTLKTNTIGELTTDNGVTIEQNLLKDYSIRCESITEKNDIDGLRISSDPVDSSYIKIRGNYGIIEARNSLDEYRNLLINTDGSGSGGNVYISKSGGTTYINGDLRVDGQIFAENMAQTVGVTGNLTIEGDSGNANFGRITWVSSSKRYKKNITYTGFDEYDKILNELNPCTFRYKKKYEHKIPKIYKDKKNIGLIAEDLLKIGEKYDFIKSSIVRNDNGKIKGINYSNFIPLLIYSNKNLRNRVKKLEEYNIQKPSIPSNVEESEESEDETLTIDKEAADTAINNHEDRITELESENKKLKMKIDELENLLTHINDKLKNSNKFKSLFKKKKKTNK